MVIVTLSHSHQSSISGGNFILSGTNVNLDSCVNWLKHGCGQRCLLTAAWLIGGDIEPQGGKSSFLFDSAQKGVACICYISLIYCRIMFFYFEALFGQTEGASRVQEVKEPHKALRQSLNLSLNITDYTLLTCKSSLWLPADLCWNVSQRERMMTMIMMMMMCGSL